MRPGVAFILGVATYYLLDHFWKAPKLPIGQHG